MTDEIRCPRCGDIFLRDPQKRRGGSTPKWCSQRCKSAAAWDRARARGYQPPTRAQNPQYRKLWAQANPKRVRVANIKSTYKVDSDTAELLAYRKGICPICESVELLHVDHDHRCCAGSKSCGVCVRGFICGSCNTGNFGDDPETYRKAYEYHRGWADGHGPVLYLAAKETT